MDSVGNREYKTVFEDYPYQKLFDSLGKGIVELETNSFEVGQIYIFIRKGHYLHSIPSEDLEIVEKILPMQLKHMFGEGNPKRDMTMRDARTVFNIDGKKYYALDISDSFIMSCYGEGERLNHEFKYSEISAILSFFNTFPDLTRGSSTKQSQFQGLVMKHFGKENYTEDDDIQDWAYFFKIPSNHPARTFMNWTENPFV